MAGSAPDPTTEVMGRTFASSTPLVSDRAITVPSNCRCRKGRRTRLPTDTDPASASGTT